MSLREPVEEARVRLGSTYGLSGLNELILARSEEVNVHTLTFDLYISSVSSIRKLWLFYLLKQYEDVQN